MKYISLLCFVFMIPLLGLSKGIKFEQGSWKDILTKAQLSKKPIFIDVYTSWCGPCKLMSRDIFPLENVGSAYNSNFVCYQIDAEKGEGREIAKKYNVNAYPTYLFVKSDGSVFYKKVGSMDADKFIGLVKTALMELKDTKSIEVWEEEYLNSKNDPDFLYAYMDKRSKVGLSNTKLFDDYLRLLPKEERASESVMYLYRKENYNLTATSFAYSNLLENAASFDKSYKGVIYTYLIAGIKNTGKEAAKLKSEELLSAAVSAYDKMPQKNIFLFREEIYLDYYQKTGESDKYLKHAADFCNNRLMRIPVDSLENLDKAFSQTIEKDINSGVLKLGPSETAEIREFVADFMRKKVCQSLNDCAQAVFKKETDTRLLRDALSWSKRSVEILPGIVAYLNTYANLLYKLGNKQEAILKEEEALQKAHLISIKEVNNIQSTLGKMKAGEKTW